MRHGKYWTLYLLLSLLILSPQQSRASTPLAWTSQNLDPVGTSEMQAIFGTLVQTPNSDRNWSIKTEPTEIGKGLPLPLSWIYYAIAPCTSDSTFGCIESVEYQVNGTRWEDAVLSNTELPARDGEVSPSGRNASGIISTQEFGTWKANSEKHEPEAGKASYWRFENAPHGGGNEYLLRVNISGSMVTNGVTVSKVQRYLEMALFPVDGLTEYQFPSNLNVKVKLRLGVIAKGLWGWFDGRITDPEVSLDVESANGILEIIGKPAQTPIGITPRLKVSEVPKEVMEIFWCPPGLTADLCPTKHGLKWFSTDGNAEIERFEQFEKGFGTVTTIGYRTEWSMKTTRWSNVANAASCPLLEEGFSGVVTTNATMYSPSAPKWNHQDKAFEFQVASPHFGLDGAPNKGTYSLVLPRYLAECRWGSDLTNARIVVSILNSETANAVISSNYSVKNEMFHFHISGFTFSAPTIKISLSRNSLEMKDETVASSGNSISGAKKGISKKSITCVNKKTKVRTKAKKGVCPSGFKRG